MLKWQITANNSSNKCQYNDIIQVGIKWGEITSVLIY